MKSESPRLVCIVEDDAAVRSSLRLLLESTGYQVTDYASAEAFLQATDGQQACCLVLDLQLGGMTGLDLLERLRARRERTPVIIVTSSGRLLEDRCAAAGALVLLHKPADPDELLRWIARTCGTPDPAFPISKE